MANPNNNQGTQKQQRQQDTYGDQSQNNNKKNINQPEVDKNNRDFSKDRKNIDTGKNSSLR